jgi:protein-S-isoprenylcysteine O-methyltransferase Ste14
MRLYRAAYNLFSVLSFAPALWLLAVLPDRAIYTVPGPWQGLMLVGQGAAAILLVVGLHHTDILTFVGFRQLGQPGVPGQLVTTGIYRYVRHPLYTFGLLLIWLSPIMTRNILTVCLGLTAYILVGIQFEERRLVREFGAAYEVYRRTTGMLLPHIRLRMP